MLLRELPIFPVRPAFAVPARLGAIVNYCRYITLDTMLITHMLITLRQDATKL